MDKVEITENEYEEYLRLRKSYCRIKDSFFDLKKKILNVRILNQAIIDSDNSQDDVLDVMVDAIYEAGKSFDVMADIIK